MDAHALLFLMGILPPAVKTLLCSHTAHKPPSLTINHNSVAQSWPGDQRGDLPLKQKAFSRPTPGREDWSGNRHSEEARAEECSSPLTVACALACPTHTPPQAGECLMSHSAS